MIVVTGGSGKLGQEIRKILPNALYPTSKEMDISNSPSVMEYFDNTGDSVECIIHCAALTSPPVVDKDPKKALDTNIIGTSNLVWYAIREGIRFIYISSDYVFEGTSTSYSEQDPLNPANKYAWSKLGGECAVRMMKDNWAIVRCSFGPNPFPYEKAFLDQFTSRERVDITAAKVVKIAKSDFTGVIHIGSYRRSVYEYAKSVSPEKDTKAASIINLDFTVPKDTSLNTRLYKNRFGEQA